MKYFMTTGDWPLNTQYYFSLMERLGHKRSTQEAAEFLLLPGGSDIGVRPLRDKAESADYQLFKKTQRPIIGICRGLQFMLTENGEKIIEHIPDTTQRIQHTTISGHWKGLSSWHKTTAGLFTNSRHHQGFTKLLGNWKILDSTDDNIIESVSRSGEFAVQWHPEAPEMDGTSALEWFVWQMNETIKR